MAGAKRRTASGWQCAAPMARCGIENMLNRLVRNSHIPRFVILPQALRIIIPPYTNEIIQLLLNSSIASVLGVRELTFWGEDFSNQKFLFEPILFVALFYFIITYSMARMTKLAEKKLRIPGLGVAHD